MRSVGSDEPEISATVIFFIKLLKLYAMKNLSAIILLLPILFGSCAKSLVVNFSEDAAATGTLHLLPSKQLSEVSLTMDGKMLVEREWIKKITVKNIPPGLHNYHLTCDNGKYKDKVDTRQEFMATGEEKTELIEVPPYSSGFWINTGLYTAGTWAFLAVLFLVDDDGD